MINDIRLYILLIFGLLNILLNLQLCSNFFIYYAYILLENISCKWIIGFMIYEFVDRMTHFFIMRKKSWKNNYIFIIVAY